jgi:predicted transcriptional regulator
MASTVKDEARTLLEELPDDVTWRDVAYQVYVRSEIEAGLSDADAGRFATEDELDAITNR